MRAMSAGGSTQPCRPQTNPNSCRCSPGSEEGLHPMDPDKRPCASIQMAGRLCRVHCGLEGTRPLGKLHQQPRRTSSPPHIRRGADHVLGRSRCGIRSEIPAVGCDPFRVVQLFPFSVATLCDPSGVYPTSLPVATLCDPSGVTQLSFHVATL